MLQITARFPWPVFSVKLLNTLSPHPSPNTLHNLEYSMISNMDLGKNGLVKRSL